MIVRVQGCQARVHDVCTAAVAATVAAKSAAAAIGRTDYDNKWQFATGLHVELLLKNFVLQLNRNLYKQWP